MRLFTAVAVATAFAFPASAQKMGSTNADAPTIEQKVTYPNGPSITLNYTSITWATGRWAEALADERRRERARERYNMSAESAPLGSFATKTAVTIAGQAVPAGEYKLMFKLDDQFAWTIVLKNDATTATIPLQLMEGGEEHKRLVLALYATGANAAGIYLGFGSQSGMLEIAPAAAKVEKGEKQAEDASGKR